MLRLGKTPAVTDANKALNSGQPLAAGQVAGPAERKGQ
jgi:hypothetical protein